MALLENNQNTMQNSSVSIQQWVDTIPPSNSQPGTSNIYVSPQKSPRKYLTKEFSLQSDDASSHCSSVESVLEFRKPDPEAVLLGLGFGPKKNTGIGAKIPSRFLHPSKLLTHIDIDKFLEQYGETRCPEPHSAPASPARARPKSY